MKKYRILIFLFLVLLFESVTLGAQSNALLDVLLEEKQASFGNTVYLALAAADIIEETASPSQASVILEQQDWGILRKEVDEPITLGEMSFLYMKTFKIRGGLLYRLFPGPRYAARELAYMGFVDGSSSAYRIPSGEEAVRILGDVLEWGGGR